MMTIIHYVIPTERKDNFYKNIINKLHIYEPIKDYISFGINFQPPWNPEEIKDAVTRIKAVGIDVRYCYNDYDKDSYDFPLLRMRDDASILNKDALYFCSIDDDIEYTCSDKTYCSIILAAINYCEDNRVGAFMIGSDEKTMRDLERNKIFNLKQLPSTRLGLILKNIYNGHMLPEHMVRKPGCNEDCTEGVYRKLESGYGAVCSTVDYIGNHFGVAKIKEKSLGSRYNLRRYAGLPGTLWEWLMENNRSDAFKKIDVDKKLPEISIDIDCDISSTLKKLVNKIKDSYSDLVRCKKISQKRNLLNSVITCDDSNALRACVDKNIRWMRALSKISSFSFIIAKKGESDEENYKHIDNILNTSFITFKMLNSENILDGISMNVHSKYQIVLDCKFEIIDIDKALTEIYSTITNLNNLKVKSCVIMNRAEDDNLTTKFVSVASIMAKTEDGCWNYMFDHISVKNPGQYFIARNILSSTKELRYSEIDDKVISKTPDISYEYGFKRISDMIYSID